MAELGCEPRLVLWPKFIIILLPCLSRSNLVRSFGKRHELEAFLVSFLKKQGALAVIFPTMCISQWRVWLPTPHSPATPTPGWVIFIYWTLLGRTAPWSSALLNVSASLRFCQQMLSLTTVCCGWPYFKRKHWGTEKLSPEPMSHSKRSTEQNSNSESSIRFIALKIQGHSPGWTLRALC